jgi:hypothetical protein
MSLKLAKSSVIRIFLSFKTSHNFKGEILKSLPISIALLIVISVVVPSVSSFCEFTPRERRALCDSKKVAKTFQNGNFLFCFCTIASSCVKKKLSQPIAAVKLKQRHINFCNLSLLFSLAALQLRSFLRYLFNHFFQFKELSQTR